MASAQELRATTKAIAEDIISFSQSDAAIARSAYSATMRRLVGQLSVRHKDLFSSIMRRAEITQSNWSMVVREVTSEILRDDLTWGKVASTFAFVYNAGRYCVEAGIQNGEQYSQVISTHLANSSTLQEFLVTHGGWDGLLINFPHPHNGWIWTGGKIALLTAVSAAAAYGLIRLLHK